MEFQNQGSGRAYLGVGFISSEEFISSEVTEGESAPCLSPDFWNSWQSLVFPGHRDLALERL